jgi:hypothetical protein
MAAAQQVRRVASSALGLVLLLCAVGATSVLAAQPASAIDNGSLGIRPSNESDFFHLSVLPGESVQAKAIVSNHTALPAELDTYAVDGLTTASGTFSLKSQGKVSEALGLWASVSVSTITVPSGGEVSVPFTITVPPATKAGDYSGGLMVQSKAVKGTTSTSGGSPVRIDVVQRQGVRIYLTVPGVARLGLSASQLEWAKSGDDIVVSVAVTNTGNSTLKPVGKATFEQWMGGSSSVVFAKPESVPPGTTVTMTARIAAPPFIQLGTVSAKIQSTAGVLKREATVIVVPLMVSLGAGATVIVITLCVWRVARFIRRARRAFAAVERAARVGLVGTAGREHAAGREH